MAGQTDYFKVHREIINGSTTLQAAIAVPGANIKGKIIDSEVRTVHVEKGGEEEKFKVKPTVMPEKRAYFTNPEYDNFGNVTSCSVIWK